MKYKRPLAGKTFGCLTVLRYLGQFPSGYTFQSKYLCACVCGKEVEVWGSNLEKGRKGCTCARAKSQATLR